LDQKSANILPLPWPSTRPRGSTRGTSSRPRQATSSATEISSSSSETSPRRLKRDPDPGELTTGVNTGQRILIE
jgi:hypothetical protein